VAVLSLQGLSKSYGAHPAECLRCRLWQHWLCGVLCCGGAIFRIAMSRCGTTTPSSRAGTHPFTSRSLSRAGSAERLFDRREKLAHSKRFP
jgi:hypothetical protein